MSDALERVLDGMSEIVHRENAPLRALTVMIDIFDPVDNGIAHVEIAAREVDLCAERHLAFLYFAVLHFLEQREVLLDGPVAVRRLCGCRGVSPVFLELLGCQLAYICQTLLDQLDRELIVLVKIVRTVEEAVSPVKAEPVDILLDIDNVLGILLRGVRVIHTEIADAAELLGHSEIDAQRLAVTDMQISVRLRRKSRVHGLARELSAFGNILLDEVVDEIGILRYLFRFSDDLFSHSLLSPLLTFRSFYYK